MKTNTCISLISFTVIFFISSLNSLAQVTIGSNSAPSDGALLQLKENENIGANATKGLGLPRVTLTSIDGLSDVGVNPTEAESHIGLVIYSAKENLCGLNYIYDGVYVWSGTKWEYLGDGIEQSPEVFTFTDPRDGEKYRYRDFGSIAGVWMLDDMRAFVYDGPGTAPILSAVDAGPPNISKQYAYPGPNGDGYIDVYFLKQPAIGILYTWAAAVNVEPGVGIDNPINVDEGESGTSVNTIRQGICPAGWHVPSDKEWSDLESAIAINPSFYSTNSGTTWDDAWRIIEGIRGDGHNNSMVSHCQPISEPSGLPSNGKAFIPEYGGFNVLLVGDLFDDRVQNFGKQVSFWSSNAKDSGASWNRRFTSENAGVSRYNNNRSRLYSVRCKQD